MLNLSREKLFELGLQHHHRGQLREAETFYRQVLAQQPNEPNALHFLGVLIGQTGNIEAAIELIRRAIAVNPADPHMHNNLGKWLGDLRRHDEAIAAHQRALELAPQYAVAHYNLGTMLQAKSQLDEAIVVYQRALALEPTMCVARNNLGNIFSAKGRLDNALSNFREAVRMQPDQAMIHSNLVYALHFHPAYDARALQRELAAWNLRHGVPRSAFIRPHSNDRHPDRPLRIGYVSPNFHDHVVGRNVLPLLRNHDRQQFQIHCFSASSVQDAIHSEFRRVADGFHDLTGAPDQQAAEFIRAQGIDILVDLTLHMAENRLLLFAFKPAPVQVTFAGYPGTTGLSTIDYRLTDRYLDPPAQDDTVYSESSVRLPDSFWCFDPLGESPPVNSLPALHKGHITFGCLNNFRKVNDPILTQWAKVLLKVPGSHLALLAPEGDHRARTRTFLADLGIAPERIHFEAIRERGDYLRLYHQIDLGLDTLPYNGHSTSLDSFYMGVPVITQVGQTVAGRAGFCQLMNLNLPELIAHSAEQFVQIATDLAGDLPRLSALRQSLRPRMQASPLMDAPRFTRNIEAAYRQMWQTWCRTLGS